jgi:hypothetical protein
VNEAIDRSGVPDPAPDPGEVEALARSRADVLERIASAAARAGRDPEAIRLVAISKTVPAPRLRAAVAAGLDLLGENRVQEALAKMDDVPGATWHLVGPLQSNKARRAVERFAAIQSVDSLDLATRLDRLAAEMRGGLRLPILLQVNVDADRAKAGFPPADLERDLPALAGLANLRLDGLMTIGRLAARPDEARASFAGLRDFSLHLRSAVPALGRELSMGMSGDYEVAVEEGATIVRVGRALFGARPT